MKWVLTRTACLPSCCLWFPYSESFSAMKPQNHQAFTPIGSSGVQRSTKRHIQKIRCSSFDIITPLMFPSALKGRRIWWQLNASASHIPLSLQSEHHMQAGNILFRATYSADEHILEGALPVDQLYTFVQLLHLPMVFHLDTSTSCPVLPTAPFKGMWPFYEVRRETVTSLGSFSQLVISSLQNPALFLIWISSTSHSVDQGSLFPHNFNLTWALLSFFLN